MITIISALLSVLSFRFRRRASLELELVALRHQLAVLRRQCSGRPRIFSSDRLLWMWLYRIWPRALNAMVLVKPATVIQWHRKGFRLYWRWGSRSRSVGRAKVSSETRDLIRQMRMANPLWGAPRIHGELLKLGIEVSREISAVAPQSPLPDLAHLSAEPRDRHCRGRHVRRCNCDISAFLRPDPPRP